MKPKGWATLLALALLFAGCGDDGDETAATDPTDATDTTTTTKRTTTTTTSSTAPTTTTDPDACPGTPGVPGAATSVHDAAADADGDGTADIVRTYLLGDSWHMVAELSSGGVTDDLSVPATQLEPGGLRIIGGTNLTGGDARAELFVVQGAGASAQIVALYQLEGCQLMRILLPNHSPAEFAVGGGVQQRGLVSCGPHDEEPVNWLFVMTASREGEGDWNVHTVGYSMSDGSPPQLVETLTQDDVFPDAGMNNRPAFKCDDLSLD